VEAAKALAEAKRPQTPYENASLTTIAEGRALQMLHVGPYDAEQPTLDALHRYAADHGLVVAGKHHEIYLNDPRKSGPSRAKTVIRLPVRAAPRSAARERPKARA
jgi:hypothetical protein